MTDTHYDTKQSVGTPELVDNSVKIIRMLAEKRLIDFASHCGDITTGWRSGESCRKHTKIVADLFEGFPCPVIFSLGNHDFNHNPDTIGEAAHKYSLDSANGQSTEILDHREWYELTQKNFHKENFIYDETTPDTLYFYTDIPEKKVRIVYLQSFYCVDVEKQVRFLAEKVFTQKDEGWKYVLLSHAPIDDRYEEGKMHHVCAGADDLKKLITALNTRTTAITTVGSFDFSDFKSNAVAFNCGHMHSSYVEFNEELKMFHATTGQTGVVGSGHFREVEADDNSTKRGQLTNDDANRYLFDIVSVTAEKYERIRFGNGLDKTVKAE
ncbi:MAG: metallophosphoesterase [Clostridia bacterium]|nr:metallophosphoesterase [Clostridia bacterium]